ncbi:MAG: DNA primase family protein, partial [Aeromonas sp.]
KLLMQRLGMVAVNEHTQDVYQYTGTLWELRPDARLKRELRVIYEERSAPYSDRTLGGVVDTMKVMVPLIPAPRDGVICFANGVYDIKTQAFRPHSPADGLLCHNDIEYGQPTPHETLEACAPNFTKWLLHVAGDEARKADRIKAALFMVLANHYDWQLFLEVTGGGGSGKSIMANLCELLVGKLGVGSSSMKGLESDHGLEPLWRKRLILLPDQSKYAGDGSVLKAITGGDEVSINPKGVTMFSAKVRAVVLAINNEPMRMSETNGGIARRRVIFAFNSVVNEANKDIAIMSKISAELPVIVRHLLTRFNVHQDARALLLEQQASLDAITVKRASDPLFDMCAMLRFRKDTNGLRLGGAADAKREPERYLYHLYLAYLASQGLDRPKAVNAMGRS